MKRKRKKHRGMASKETFEAKILVPDDERLIRMTVCARETQRNGVLHTVGRQNKEETP
jgi:hypothetical protein